MQQNVNWQITTTVLVLMVISFGGIALGFLYSRLPANNPQESQAGCESVGGEWDSVASMCLVSYKEEGESCTDGGQCKSGICSPPTLSTEERASLTHGPVSGIVGVCAGSSEVTGCVPQVQNGTVTMESMCEE